MQVSADLKLKLTFENNERLNFFFTKIPMYFYHSDDISKFMVNFLNNLLK